MFFKKITSLILAKVLAVVLLSAILIISFAIQLNEINDFLSELSDGLFYQIFFLLALQVFVLIGLYQLLSFRKAKQSYEDEKISSDIMLSTEIAPIGIKFLEGFVRGLMMAQQEDLTGQKTRNINGKGLI